MSDKIFQRTYQALNYLYLNSKEIQKEIQLYNPTERHNNYLTYAKEFVTVKLTTARRSGHTTAICKFVLAHQKENYFRVFFNIFTNF
jgi:hypothetical protein